MAPAVDNTHRQLERQRVDRLGTPVQIAASVPLIVYNFGQFSVVQDVRSDAEVRSLEMGAWSWEMGTRRLETGAFVNFVSFCASIRSSC